MWAAALAGVAAPLPLATQVGTTLTVDPAASRVRVHLGRAGLRFLGHDHELTVPLASGKLEIDETDPGLSRLALVFDAAQIAVVPGTEPAGDVDGVERRMRGDSVLDVKRFPTIRFQSATVAVEPAGGAGAYRVRVRGTLEIKDQRVPLELPVSVQRDARGLTATGEAWLELRALGIEPPSVAGVVKVANRFRLAFEIRAHA